MEIQWSLVLFTIFAGAGAGMLAFAGVGEFFNASKNSRLVAAICAVVLLIAGGISSLLHLGNPANVMAAATNLGSFSPISLELIFLGACVLVALVYLVLVARGVDSATKIVGVIGILVGVVFAYVSGHGYEVIAAKPAWATPTLTLSYLFSALALGGFLFLLLQVVFKDDAASIKKVGLIVLVVAALETIGYIAYGALTPLAENALIFWIGAAVIGGLIAAAAGVLIYMKNNQAMVYIGVLAVLIGGIAFRAVMWLAGESYLTGFFYVCEHLRGLYPL